MANLQFARDENGKRITPFPQGKSFCQVCDGAMIAKCGEIYRWHWQHVRERNCDSWKEHETAWHRTWKERFPEEWREVIIARDGEKHIADIHTNSGTVIEFQNSPISSTTILVRESFYGNMLWVINAKSFSNNFSIRSTVSTRLKRLEESYKHDLKYLYSTGLNDNIEYNKKLLNLERDKELHIRTQKEEQRKLEELNDCKKNLDDLVEKTLNSWEKETYPYFSMYGLCDIAQSHKKDYKNKSAEILSINLRLGNSVKRLKAIEELNTYDYLRIKYAIVTYNDLRIDMIDRSIIILRSDKETFFPTILKFQSEYDFLSYKYKTEKYLFAVDPTITVEKIKSEILCLKNDYENSKNNFPDYKAILLSEFTKFIKNELELNEARFYKASEEQMKVQSQIHSIQIEKENMRQNWKNIFQNRRRKKNWNTIKRESEL